MGQLFQSLEVSDELLDSLSIPLMNEMSEGKFPEETISSSLEEILMLKHS